MPDLAEIFAASTAQFRVSGLYAGVGSMSVWSDIFKAMRQRLEKDGATPEAMGAFRGAVQRGIDSARESELNADERVALTDTLASAFDGFVRSVPTTLAPKAGFLRHVAF